MCKGRAHKGPAQRAGKIQECSKPNNAVPRSAVGQPPPHPAACHAHNSGHDTHRCDEGVAEPQHPQLIHRKERRSKAASQPADDAVKKQWTVSRVAHWAQNIRRAHFGGEFYRVLSYRSKQNGIHHSKRQADNTDDKKAGIALPLFQIIIQYATKCKCCRAGNAGSDNALDGVELTAPTLGGDAQNHVFQPRRNKPRREKADGIKYQYHSAGMTGVRQSQRYQQNAADGKPEHHAHKPYSQFAVVHPFKHKGRDKLQYAPERRYHGRCGA